MNTHTHDWAAELDPTPVSLSDIEPLTDTEIEGWDNLDGVDIDGYADDNIVVDTPWLHALLYSDYAEPSDDDDRPTMDIPQEVINRYTT